MLAAIEGCKSTFDEMVKTNEGIKVVKKTLLHLAQDQPQQAGYQTTVSVRLKVSI